MNKRVKIIFTLSVILNVLLVGIIGGHAYKRIHEFDMSSWDEVKPLLAPPTRELIDKIKDEKKDRIVASIKEVRKYKTELEEIIGAPEFDNRKFNRTVRHWQDFQDRVTAGKIETIKTVARKASQEDRQKLASRFANMLMGGHGKFNKEHNNLSEGYEKGSKPPKPEAVVKPEEKKPPENKDYNP